MSLRDQPAQHFRPEEDNEAIVIDWRKVLQFFLIYYRYLLIGAFGGVLLGLAVSFGFQSYEIRLVLPNVFKAEVTNYRELLLDWTNRAQEIARQKSLAPADEVRYRSFASQQWWNRHVTPLYAVNKVDLKDRVGTVDSKGSGILALELKLSEQNISAGTEDIFHFRHFIYSAYAYKQTHNLIKSYEQESLSSIATIDKDTNLNEIKLADTKRKISHLEELQKRYPSSGVVNNQVIESRDSAAKDSAAKYLPITTQLIATKNDLFAINERLSQVRERKKQIKLIEQFLSEAKPILMQEQDGLKLITRLLEAVANLRKALSSNDLYLNSALDLIQGELLNIQTLLLPSFNDPPAPTIISTLHISKSIALGFLGGSFLALLICLGLYFWPSFKRAIAKAQEME